MRRELNRFVAVGAAKTGSTWLHACLEEHPDVCVPLRAKEVGYFDRFHDRGVEWYESFFTHRRDEAAVGEVNPAYLTGIEVPARMHAYDPDLRLVFVLRDPIERAYSHYCMHLRAGMASADIDAELVPGNALVEEGFYLRHIGRFAEHFARDQLLVQLYDDLARDPAAFLGATFAFLGVDTGFEPSMLRKTYHPRRALPRFPRTFNAIAGVAAKAAWRSRLVYRAIEAARRSGLTGIAHRFNRGGPFPRLSPAGHHQLADLYRPDVDRLADWLGRDLGHWMREPR